MLKHGMGTRVASQGGEKVMLQGLEKQGGER
jgi:hypothetical protein